jgi:SAM-dependent methyltransferase
MFRNFYYLVILPVFFLAYPTSVYSATSSSEKEVKQFNRILDNQARKDYAEAIKTLFKTSPEMMKRKIPKANVQQGFVLDTVLNFAKSNSKILSAGCFEDTAYMALVELGYKVEGIDPEINYDLNTFFNLPTTKKGGYDIIFSTSVIEHVKDDELFLRQISELLAPGGIGVLTCDYEDSWTPEQGIFPSNFRFYTQKDLKQRLLPCLVDCQLIDEPKWDCKNPDFELAGKKYTFATFVFQKRA